MRDWPSLDRGGEKNTVDELMRAHLLSAFISGQ